MMFAILGFYLLYNGGHPLVICFAFIILLSIVWFSNAFLFDAAIKKQIEWNNNPIHKDEKSPMSAYIISLCVLFLVEEVVLFCLVPLHMNKNIVIII